MSIPYLCGNLAMALPISEFFVSNKELISYAPSKINFIKSTLCNLHGISPTSIHVAPGIVLWTMVDHRYSRVLRVLSNINGVEPYPLWYIDLYPFSSHDANDEQDMKACIKKL
jgi:hypothetical protein